jgi:hypothetical protein
VTNGIGVAVLALACAGLVIWFARRSFKSQASEISPSVATALDDLAREVRQLKAYRHPLPDNVQSDDRMSVDSQWHVVYGHPDSPGIDVSLSDLPDVRSLRAIDLPEGPRAQISDFVLNVAHLYGEKSGIQTWALRFSPEVTRQSNNGQLELMKTTLGQKPIAINPSNGNKIAEIGNLITTINPVAAVAFAWQVLAVITAQKFMADISKRLTAIENEVAGLRQFLIDEQEAEIIANYEYLGQVTASVLQGSLGPEDVIVIGTQLEDIERQSTRTLHVGMKSGRHRLEMLKEKHGRAFTEGGLNESLAYAEKEAGFFTNYSRLCLLALWVRGTATYLRAALPLNKVIAKNRLARIQDDLKRYRALQSEFGEKVHALNETIKATFPWQHESGFIKRGKDSLDNSLVGLNAKCGEIESMTDTIATAVMDKSGASLVYARVQDERVSLMVPGNTTSSE